MDIGAVCPDKIGDSSLVRFDCPRKFTVQSRPYSFKRFLAQVLGTRHQRSACEFLTEFVFFYGNIRPVTNDFQVRRPAEFACEQPCKIAPVVKRSRKRNSLIAKAQEQEPGIRRRIVSFKYLFLQQPAALVYLLFRPGPFQL